MRAGRTLEAVGNGVPRWMAVTPRGVQNPAYRLAQDRADVAQLAARRLPKSQVAGSSPVVRSKDSAGAAGSLGAMPDTNAAAARTEGLVLAALVKTGQTVSLPFGVARYDLVLDTGEGLKRVQCKTGRLERGAVVFNARSVHRTAPGHYANRGYQGEADLFGVYCPGTDKVYLVPVGDCVNVMSLRVEPTRNGQCLGVRFAADYEVK